VAQVVQCLLSKIETPISNPRTTKKLLSSRSVFLTKKNKQIPVPLPHPCHAKYSRGRFQEDCASKPAPAKLFIRLYLKKNYQKKRAGGLPQVVKVPA
jgi:hypothetical protein